MTDQELKVLTDIRWALGDNGKRMQSELVEYARQIKNDADEVFRLRERVRELEAAMADAARFRWLGEVALGVDMVADPDNLVQVWHETLSGHATTGRTLREAVDEAMKRHNAGIQPKATA